MTKCIQNKHCPLKSLVSSNVKNYLKYNMNLLKFMNYVCFGGNRVNIVVSNLVVAIAFNYHFCITT